jgi:hypothetical protein
MAGMSNAANDAKLIALLKANPGVQQSQWEELAGELRIARKMARFWLENRVNTKDVSLTKGPKNASIYTWIGPKSNHSLKIAS